MELIKIKTFPKKYIMNKKKRLFLVDEWIDIGTL